MDLKNKISRRNFIKTSCGVASLAIAGIKIPLFAEETKSSKVILIRDENAVGDDNKINAQIVRSMLDKAVSSLTNVKTPTDAWKKLIKPNDIVGVKSNIWPMLPTPPELESAIKERVMEVGVPEKNIAITDREVLSSPVFQKSTALINIRPLRTHFWAGIGGCIKNYIVFVSDPYNYHPDACSEIGKIWHLPAVKDKTRLNVLVALTPQFYGRGPHFFDKKYVWRYNGLFVGHDPVALDAVGAKLLQVKRVSYFGEDKPLDKVPKFIEVADKKYNLGTSNLEKIELLKIGWEKDILI